MASKAAPSRSAVPSAKPGPKSTVSGAKATGASAGATKTSTSALKAVSAEDFKAAGFATSICDAVIAGFSTHAPELCTLALEVEHFSPELLALCDNANTALSILSALELQGSRACELVNVPTSQDAFDRFNVALDGVVDGVTRVKPALLKAAGTPNGDVRLADQALAAVSEAKLFGRIIWEVQQAVSRRDLPAAKSIVWKNQRLISPEGSGGSVHSIEAVLLWLKKEWIPAAEKWSALLSPLHDARARRDAPAIQAAARSAKVAAEKSAAELAPLLKRNEHVTQLVEENVLQPATSDVRKINASAQSRNELIAATSSCDFQRLAAAVRQVELDANWPAEPGDDDLLASARRLLLDLQSMAKITVSLTTAMRERNPADLARAIKNANKHMLKIGCCGDAAVCQDAVDAIDDGFLAFLESPRPTPRPLPPVNTLVIEHVPGRAWAPELSIVYFKAGTELGVACQQRLCAAEVYAALDGIRQREGLVTDAHRALVQQAQRLGLEGDPQFGGAMQELLLHVRRAYGVVVKVHFESATRAFSVFDRMSFQAVRAAIVSGLDVSDGAESLRLRYEDDGDFVTVSNQSDWELLVSDKLRDADAAKGLRVELYADRAAANFTSPVQDRRAAGPTPPRAPAFTSPKSRPSPQPSAAQPQPPRRYADSPKPERQQPKSGATGPSLTDLKEWSRPDGDAEFDLKTVASEATEFAAPVAAVAPVRFVDKMARTRASLAQLQAELNAHGGSGATGGAVPSAWRVPDPEEQFDLHTVASESTNVSLPTEFRVSDARAMAGRALPPRKMNVPPPKRAGPMPSEISGINGFVLRGSAAPSV